MNIFLGKMLVKKDWKDRRQHREGNIFFKVLESIRHRFASFDTLVQLTPISFINLCRWLVFSVLVYGYYLYNNGMDLYLFGGANDLSKFLRSIFDIKISYNPGINAMYIGMLLSIFYRLLYRVYAYIKSMITGVYLFLVEDARIKKMSIFKKIFYIFTWPTFDIIGRYTTYIALFTNVTWKPIPHNSKVTIDDLKEV
jgi:hypothetical protein